VSTKAPIIQRVPCAIHSERVAALCHKCHELAERERDMQWTKQRKEAHKEYLKRESANAQRRA
jgi:hypothetical protein